MFANLGNKDERANRYLRPLVGLHSFFIVILVIQEINRFNILLSTIDTVSCMIG